MSTTVTGDIEPRRAGLVYSCQLMGGRTLISLVDRATGDCRPVANCAREPADVEAIRPASELDGTTTVAKAAFA